MSEETKTATTEVAKKGIDDIENIDMSPANSNSQVIKFHQFEGTDLSKMAGQFKKGNVTLSEDYWTPEAAGEERLVQFLGYKWMTTQDDATIEIAVFGHDVAGVGERFSNGSKVLVGQMQDNNVHVGDVLYITYDGKQPTKDGKRTMDTWTVVPGVPK